MGSQSFIPNLIKKVKHSDKHLPDKNVNNAVDKDREKTDRFIEMINCYSNIKNKK
ncbi:hypothetical protein [Desulfoscipio gibsoniae]|uniref:Uncharacterized protein n=1 Tax=Desulfoscipio gibsoniae DSM 7213 TaxID=767817 RepID=R4KJA2_9FIRM|nr:hypothetical protein [Desulfoscipio gibsoniae]AGL02699.1 hypothetical protein Desgi_3354 [Desulfoscipio gibsoniae DSM 7213]